MALTQADIDKGDGSPPSLLHHAVYAVYRSWWRRLWAAFRYRHYNI